MDLAKLHLHWRESTHKGVTYRSYSLARAYRENGKNKKEIVAKLGKLDEAEVQRWRSTLQAFKLGLNLMTTAPKGENLVVLSHRKFLDVAFVATLWDEWELDRLFPAQGRRKVDVAAIAKMLVINRCLDPLSKKCVSDWAKKSVIPQLIGVKDAELNSSRVYRELEVIEDCKEDICAHIYAKLRRHNPTSLDHAFYDLSSSTFHGTKCALVGWGFCKDGFQNHIVLAVLVNRDGLPIYWEVLPGKTSDVKTIKMLLDRVGTRFKTTDTTVVFDRGFVSDGNLSKFENKQIKYITALDKPQIEAYADYDFTQTYGFTSDLIEQQISRRPSFQQFDDVTYFRDVQGMKNNRRYILGFNIELFKAQRAMREKSIEEFLAFANNLNHVLRHEVQNDRDEAKTYKQFREVTTRQGIDDFVTINLRNRSVKWIDDFGVAHLVNSFEAKPEIDLQKKYAAGRLDGFWILTTNHTEKEDERFAVSSREIIQAYRDKHIVESTFRDIKSSIQFSPVYVWNEKHVRAHYTICALAHLLNRTLDLKLKANQGQYSREIISHDRCYEQLASCQFTSIRFGGGNVTNEYMTELNDIQRELIVRAKSEHLITRDFLDKCRHRKA